MIVFRSTPVIRSVSGRVALDQEFNDHYHFVLRQVISPSVRRRGSVVCFLAVRTQKPAQAIAVTSVRMAPHPALGQLIVGASFCSLTMIHYTAIASCFTRENAWEKSGGWMFSYGPLMVIYWPFGL